MSESMPTAPDVELRRLVEQVRDASARKAPLNIVGGDTKAFYGNPVVGELLSTRTLSGISDYAPTELVITVRAGTPLADVEEALAERGQYLAFEPPRFAPGGTVGGMVAAGLSGPSRAAAGAARDHVLGASLLNGRGEVLSFGGQVMKNVAGYDVSRLLVGSLGTLGVILEVSLRAVPRPVASCTLRFEMDEAQAVLQINRWGGQPLPINASAWLDGRLWLRLAGARAAVHAAAHALGGEVIAPADEPWRDLRDHRHAYFNAAWAALEQGASLWRVSVAATTPPLQLPGRTLIEWGGAQRWLVTDASAEAIRESARASGGHATLFRGHGDGVRVFAPLSQPVARIHDRLKKAFDPDRLFNRGRLH
jgi:glycolate oxidase FAD binding subunit